MNEPKFKEGDWVKYKTGTQGMTVVSSEVGESTSGNDNKVRCRFKNTEGEEVEEDFQEADLAPL